MILNIVIAVLGIVVGWILAPLLNSSVDKLFKKND